MLPINMGMSERITTIMTNMSFLNLEGSTLPKSKREGFLKAEGVGKWEQTDTIIKPGVTPLVPHYKICLSLSVMELNGSFAMQKHLYGTQTLNVSLY